MSNKTPWIVGAIIAVILIGVGVAALGGNPAAPKVDDKMSKKMELSSKANEAMMKKDEVMTKASDAMMAKSEVTKDAMMMKEDAMMKSEDAMMKKEDTMMKKDETAMSKKTGYMAYSPEAVTANANGKNIIFFHATWCPTCKAGEADINANLSKIPAGVNILKADYDASTDLKKKYGVTQQSTFVVVDGQGNKVKSANGLTTLDSMLNLVK